MHRILISTLFLFLLSSSQLFAADVMSVTNLEATDTGRVSSADLLKPGNLSLRLGMTEDQNPSISNNAAIDTEQSDVAKVQQMSTVLGIGVTSFMELHLGVHGTQEIYNQGGRGAVYGDEKSSDALGFSGASLLTKVRFINYDSVKVSVAPFIESGVGSAADLSISRSSGYKGGWMLLSTYEAPSVVKFHINAGYRYREREQVADLSLRNELFYQASTEAILSRNASVFVSGRGRSIKVSDERDYELTGERTYKSRESFEAYAGLIGRVNQFELSGYGGERLKENSFGSGSVTFGVSLGYLFKGKSSSAPESAVIIADEKKEDKPVQVVDKAIDEAEYALPNIAEDSAAAYEANDDFSAIKKQIDHELESDLKESKPSDDELVERELREIKKAEEKIQEEQDKIDEQNFEKDRKRLLEERKQDLESEKELRNEVREDLDLPEITDDELNWDGLN